MAKNWLEMVEKRLLIIPHLFRLIIEGRYFRLWSLSLCPQIEILDTDAFVQSSVQTGG